MPFGPLEGHFDLPSKPIQLQGLLRRDLLPGDRSQQQHELGSNQRPRIGFVPLSLSLALKPLPFGLRYLRGPSHHDQAGRYGTQAVLGVSHRPDILIDKDLAGLLLPESLETLDQINPLVLVILKRQIQPVDPHKEIGFRLHHGPQASAVGVAAVPYDQVSRAKPMAGQSLSALRTGDLQVVDLLSPEVEAHMDPIIRALTAQDAGGGGIDKA